MAYLLVAAAVIISMVRLMTLTRSHSHRPPWAALIVWALLLAGSAAIWLATTNHL